MKIMKNSGRIIKILKMVGRKMTIFKNSGGKRKWLSCKNMLSKKDDVEDYRSFSTRAYLEYSFCSSRKNSI